MPFIFNPYRFGLYNIENAIWLNGTDEQLSRTNSGAQTSVYKYAISTWFRPSDVAFGSAKYLWAGNSNTHDLCYHVGGTQTLGLNIAGTGSQITSAVFRDPISWYHIFLVVDTTQVTAADRWKLYVNGELVTSWGTGPTYPAQNTTVYWHKDAQTNYIGAYSGGARSDGAFAEFHSIDFDGTTPAVTDFGETDATTGVWKAKAYAGSYGNNGFYLDFSNGAALGTDASGNGNDWTATNIDSTNQVTNTPTNVYATLNPLWDPVADGKGTASDGNRLMTFTTARDWLGTTLGIKSGMKTHVEVEFLSGSIATNNSGIHLYHADSKSGDSSAIQYLLDGTFKIDGVSQTALSTYTTNDIITLEIDYDAATVLIKKNDVTETTANCAAFTTSMHPVLRGATSSGTGTARIYVPEDEWNYSASAGYGALNTNNIGTATKVESGTFDGNASTDGPFIWMGGTPDDGTVTLNGNAATRGTHYDALATGIKIRTASATYNPNSTGVNWTATVSTLTVENGVEQTAQVN